MKTRLQLSLRAVLSAVLLVLVGVPSPASADLLPTLRIGLGLDERGWRAHARAFEPKVLAEAADRFGVSAGRFSRLFAAIASGRGDGYEATEGEVMGCARYLADDFASRDRLISCLTRLGRAALGEPLARWAMEARLARYLETPTVENSRSALLLSWLEDLARAWRAERGQSAAWLVPGQGFVPMQAGYAGFPYQDGDVILTMRGSVVSALTAQATFPQRTVSHVLMARVRDGKLMFVESEKEGSIRFSLETFRARKYREVVVLRWRGNPEALRKASDEAWRIGGLGLPYDFVMDMKDPSRMFCVEMVLAAFAKGSDRTAEQLVPRWSIIRSESVYQFARSMGIGARVMPSPGDLMASGDFVTVGSFRDPSQLFSRWSELLASDTIMSTVEGGSRFEAPSETRMAGPLLAKVDHWLIRLGSSVGKPWKVLPVGLAPDDAAGLLMLRRYLYEPLIRVSDFYVTESGREPSLLTASPWAIAAPMHAFVGLARSLGILQALPASTHVR